MLRAIRIAIYVIVFILSTASFLAIFQNGWPSSLDEFQKNVGGEIDMFRSMFKPGEESPAKPSPGRPR